MDGIPAQIIFKLACLLQRLFFRKLQNVFKKIVNDRLGARVLGDQTSAQGRQLDKVILVKLNEAIPFESI